MLGELPHPAKIMVSFECSQYLQQAQAHAADCSFNSRRCDLHRHPYSCAPLHTHTIKTKISQEAPHPASSTLSSQNLLDGSCSVPKEDAGCTQPTEEAQRHFLARESLESAIREPERGTAIYSRVCGSQYCYHSGSGKLFV